MRKEKDSTFSLHLKKLDFCNFLSELKKYNRTDVYLKFKF